MNLEESLSLVLMEIENKENWAYDHNTTVLLTLKENIASLLRASLIVSDNCRQPENLEPLGFIAGMADTLNWLMDNMELVRKDGSSDGSFEP